MNDFTINLDSTNDSKTSFSFKIKDQFFEEFSFADIKHVNINAEATLKKDGRDSILELAVIGRIHQVPCDICTEDLSIEIFGETSIVIRKSQSRLVSTDEVLYIKQNETNLNIKQLIFELIIVNIPKQRRHPIDKYGESTCNTEMVNLIKKYMRGEKKSSDPRWDELKNLI